MLSQFVKFERQFERLVQIQIILLHSFDICFSTPAKNTQRLDGGRVYVYILILYIRCQFTQFSLKIRDSLYTGKKIRNTRKQKYIYMHIHARTHTHTLLELHKHLCYDLIECMM